MRAFNQNNGAVVLKYDYSLHIRQFFVVKLILSFLYRPQTSITGVNRGGTGMEISVDTIGMEFLSQGTQEA